MQQRLSVLTAAVLLAAAAPAARAQAQAAPPDPAPLTVGAVAPDFSLPGATRYGPLSTPVHLADLKGKVVVVAFYFKARTRG